MQHIWNYIALAIGGIGFPLSLYHFYQNRRAEQNSDAEMDSPFIASERQRRYYQMAIYLLFLLSGIVGCLFT